MWPLLNADHDPAEYVAIARAVGVDPYELLAQAENEVGGRHRLAPTPWTAGVDVKRPSRSR